MLLIISMILSVLVLMYARLCMENVFLAFVGFCMVVQQVVLLPFSDALLYAFGPDLVYLSGLSFRSSPVSVQGFGNAPVSQKHAGK